MLAQCFTFECFISQMVSLNSSFYPRLLQCCPKNPQSSSILQKITLLSSPAVTRVPPDAPTAMAVTLKLKLAGNWRTWNLELNEMR